MMFDLICRADAIDAFESLDWYHCHGDLVHGANSKEDVPLYKADDVYKTLNEIASARSIKLSDMFLNPSVLDGKDGDENINVSMTVDDLKHIYKMTLEETVKRHEQQT